MIQRLGIDQPFIILSEVFEAFGSFAFPDAANCNKGGKLLSAGTGVVSRLSQAAAETSEDDEVRKDALLRPFASPPRQRRIAKVPAPHVPKPLIS